VKPFNLVALKFSILHLKLFCSPLFCVCFTSTTDIANIYTILISQFDLLGKINDTLISLLYTVSQKTSTFYFVNNYVKNHTIFMVFGTRYPQEIRHLRVINLPTSPVYCGYTTLKRVKSHILTMLFIHSCKYCS